MLTGTVAIFPLGSMSMLSEKDSLTAHTECVFQEPYLWCKVCPMSVSIVSYVCVNILTHPTEDYFQREQVWNLKPTPHFCISFSPDFNKTQT